MIKTSVRLHDEELKMLAVLSELDATDRSSSIRASIRYAYHARFDVALHERDAQAAVKLIASMGDAFAQSVVQELLQRGMELEF